jgi:hypothetical protein
MTTISVRLIPGTAMRSCVQPELPNPTLGIYYTHSNGGRPYKVTVTPDRVEILDNTQGTLLFNYNNPIKVWIGESPVTDMTQFSHGYGEKFTGNSFLIETTANHYVFIGHKIFDFTTPYKIINYVSEVGNSDVPYPYAVDSDQQYYLMIEDVILSNVPLKYSNDPYGYYYSNGNKYVEILNIRGFVCGDENFRVSFQTDPRSHYQMGWMKNLHAIDKDTGNTFPVSETDYIKMMDSISMECGYHPLLSKLMNSPDDI